MIAGVGAYSAVSDHACTLEASSSDYAMLLQVHQALAQNQQSQPASAYQYAPFVPFVPSQVLQPGKARGSNLCSVVTIQDRGSTKTHQACCIRRHSGRVELDRRFSRPGL